MPTHSHIQTGSPAAQPALRRILSARSAATILAGRRARGDVLSASVLAGARLFATRMQLSQARRLHRTSTLRIATLRIATCLAREPLAVRMGWTAACSGLMALLDLFRAAIADQTPATAVSIARHRPIVRSHAAHARLGTHYALIDVFTATARHATCLILQIARP